MFEIFSTTAILFGAIFLGIFYSFIKIFKTDDSKILIRYVFNIALPCSLFVNCFHCQLEAFNIKYILCYSIAVIVTSIIYIYISRVYLKKSFSNAFLNTLAVTQFDGAYFTIPLFMILFNDVSHVIGIQLIQNVIFFPLVVFFINFFYEPENNAYSSKKSFKELIMMPLRLLVTNPFIIGSILGLVFGSLNLKINTKILNFLDLFGRSASAVALFSIGVSFYGHFKKLTDRKLLESFSLLTFGKLMIFPLFAFLAGKAIGLPNDLLFPLILVAASPTATHCYVVANRYNLEEDVQTNTIIATTILSFITISVLIFLFG